MDYKNQLTKEEYLILPFEERMAYADQLFGYKVAALKNVGDRIVFGHIIDSCFYEYFENCGCYVIGEDLGAEITEIVKIHENNYIKETTNENNQPKVRILK